MQEKYILQFGNNPYLSRAEIKSRLKEFYEDFKISQTFSIYAGKISDAQKLLDTLGGTIKIGKLVFQGNKKEVNQKILDYLLSIFSRDKKNNFAISTLPEKTSWNRNILLNLKKSLKKEGLSVRFANRNFASLDTGAFHKEKGVIEICILQKGEDVFLFHTLATQNVELFAKRDFGKLIRDMNVGMLPPKLALMMLNLTTQNSKLPNCVWDPFCGTGSILIEAGFLNINTIGSDILDKMIENTKKNFEYYFVNQKTNLFQNDASKMLDKKIEAEAICTETYLGPIYRFPLSDNEFIEAKQKVSKILEGFFEVVHQNFSGKIMVVAIPFWKLKNDNLGFLEKPVEIAKKVWQTSEDFDYNTLRQSFIFRRENQITGREIFVFKRK